MRILLLLLLPFLAFAQTTELHKGLIAHFDFEDTATGTIEHSYPQGATFKASTLRQQAGQVMVLNGQDQHLLLNDGIPEELLGVNEKMIVCWVYPSTAAGTSFFFMGPPTGQCGQGATLRWVTNASGQMGVDISCGLRFTSVNLKANEWNLVYLHFRAGVFEIGSVKADGIERATITDLHYHNLQQGVAMIGGNIVNRRYLMGAMDDVRLYNRRLSDCELLALWQGNTRKLRRSNCSGGLPTLDQQGQVKQTVPSISPINNSPSAIVELEEETIEEETVTFDLEVKEEVVYESMDIPDSNRWETARLTPEIREVLRSRESLFTTSEVIRIAVFDSRMPDGDAVSLHFNGQLLAEHIMLRQQPQEFTAQLVEGINAVRINLVAEGTQGSNTCLVRVSDGQQTYYLNFPDYRSREATLTIVKD